MANISWTTITAAIKALTINGLTIYDIDEMRETLDSRSAYLFPDPVNMISGLQISRESYGLEPSAYKNATYNLTYTFCYQPIGTGRLLAEQYKAMVDMAAGIIETISETDFASVGGIELTPFVDGPFGVVVDPSGAPYHGCQIKLSIMEFIQ